MEGLEITKKTLTIDECTLQKSNYLSDSPSPKNCVCLPSGNTILLLDYVQLLQASASLSSKISLVKLNGKTNQIAAVTGQSLTLCVLEKERFTFTQQTTRDPKLKIKDVAWHPILNDILLVSFVNKLVIYDIKNEFNQIFSHELSHGIECRWNKQGNILICTTSEEIIAFEWTLPTENNFNMDWSQYKKHELLTCRSTRNIVFFGGDNYFWTQSTPTLTIPNKETFIASKKQNLDEVISPSQGSSKPLGILDSLTNISSKLLSQAEEIQTETEESEKELPRIHLIHFDEEKSRLYEVLSIEHANITPYSMLSYSEQKQILLVGSKQKIDVFECNNNTKTPKHTSTWDLPSILLGLKCEDDKAVLLLGQQKINNNNGSFLSFETTTKYTDLEIWNVKLPNLEKPTAITGEASNTTNLTQSDAILSAIQNLQLFVEDQFRRVNERLDRIETTLKINSK